MWVIKNFRRVSCYLISTFFIFIIFLVSGIICNYWTKLELISSYNNTPYNKYAIYFIMSSLEREADLTDIQQNNLLSECALLKYNDDMLNMNEVLYCDKNIVESRDGKLLDLRFDSGTPCAVVGIDSGYQIGEYVYNNGKSYEIIDIMERHIASAINSGVFYTNANLNIVSANDTYVLVSSNNKHIMENFINLVAFFKSKDITVKQIDIRNAQFTDFIHYNKTTICLFAFVVVFDIIFIYIIRHTWLKIKASEIFVLNLLGYMHIRRKLKIEYFSMWLCAYLLSLIIFIILKEKCYHFKIIIELLTGILGCAFISAINIYNVNR